MAESNDEWVEITAEEAERIRKAKEAAKGSVDYPEEKVNQMIGLFAAQINNMDITDEQSLQYKDLYPQWSEFIGKSLKANFKVNHNDKLYKTRQEIPPFESGTHEYRYFYPNDDNVWRID